MMAQFNDEGYLVVEDVFDVDTDLQPVVEDYATTLDALAEQWHSEGKISDTYRHLSFGHYRLAVSCRIHKYPRVF